jgi:hypothetical protein
VLSARAVATWLGLGQREEEYFHVSTVGSGVVALEALLESGGDNGEPGAIDGLGGRGQLGDDRAAVTAEPQLGALLPCIVVVRRAPAATETTIAAIDPQTMVKLSQSDTTRVVANEADVRIQAALTEISRTVGT